MPKTRIAAGALVVAALASLPPSAPALEPPASDDPAQTQSPAQGGASPPVLLAPCCKFTNYYLFPSGPVYLQCCAPLSEPVAALPLSGPSAAAQEAPGESLQSTVTINKENARVLARGVEPTCVRLSELTPLERLVRSLRAVCVSFVTYDHSPCSCETRCNDPAWLCDCPGVPPGELPETPPQDSLGSQPEFLGTICTPCNTQSTCADSEPPPSGPPL